MTPKGARVAGMFSVTFPEDIQRTAKDLLNNYIFNTVGIVDEACEDVEQTFIETERLNERVLPSQWTPAQRPQRSEKRSKLLDMMKTTRHSDKVIIFWPSKQGTKCTENDDHVECQI